MSSLPSITMDLRIGSNIQRHTLKTCGSDLTACCIKNPLEQFVADSVAATYAADPQSSICSFISRSHLLNVDSRAQEGVVARCSQPT
jgi:hypothetical protein